MVHRTSTYQLKWIASVSEERKHSLTLLTSCAQFGKSKYVYVREMSRRAAVDLWVWWQEQWGRVECCIQRSEKSMPELLWIQTAEIVESEQQLSFMRFVRVERGWCAGYVRQLRVRIYVCWLVKNRRMNVYIFIAASLSHRSIVSEQNITMSAFKIPQLECSVTSWKVARAKSSNLNILFTHFYIRFIFLVCCILNVEDFMNFAWHSMRWQPTNGNVKFFVYGEKLSSVHAWNKLLRVPFSHETAKTFTLS